MTVLSLAPVVATSIRCGDYGYGLMLLGIRHAK